MKYIEKQLLEHLESQLKNSTQDLNSEKKNYSFWEGGFDYNGNKLTQNQSDEILENIQRVINKYQVIRDFYENQLMNSQESKRINEMDYHTIQENHSQTLCK